MILDHLDGNHLACVHGFALDHLAEGAGAQLVENKESAREARLMQIACEQMLASVQRAQLDLINASLKYLGRSCHIVGPTRPYQTPFHEYSPIR